jgi:hypothetical protein
MKNLREFESLFCFNMTEDGIFEYNICSLLDYLGCEGMDYNSSNIVFKDFLDTNNITYYAAPRESFWVSEGLTKCRLEGNMRVVMEDLS